MLEGAEKLDKNIRIVGNALYEPHNLRITENEGEKYYTTPLA